MADIIQRLLDTNGTAAAEQWKEPLRAQTGLANATLFPFNEVDSNASEQYRMVRTKLAQMGHNPRMLAITSPQSRDGKTVTAVNLGAALAFKSDSGVLLVDADLRRSSVAAMLGLPASPGLREVLEGRCCLEEAIVRVDAAPNLSVLPAGDKGGNPAELFDGSAWKRICREMRTAYQSVIVDTTPAGVVADYELVQAEVDCVILVVRPNHTNRDRFYESLRIVTPEKLLGVICNCMPKVSRYGETYGEYGAQGSGHRTGQGSGR